MKKRCLSILLVFCLLAALIPAVPAPTASAADAWRGDMYRLINQAREKEGLAPLNTSSYLNACAMIRAREIRQSLSHTRPDGRPCQSVLEDMNLPGNLSYTGENLAVSSDEPASSAMDTLMASPPHRAILMDPNFNFVGIGLSYQDGAFYWIQLFTRNDILEPENGYFEDPDTKPALIPVDKPTPTPRPTVTPAPTLEPNLLGKGSCGENVSWTLSKDGVLTLSGTGAVDSYAGGKPPWRFDQYGFGWADRITSIVVEPGITALGASCFQDLYKLKSVSLPDTLTDLAEFTFSTSGDGMEISLPDSVTHIGSGCFQYASISRLTLGKNTASYAGEKPPFENTRIDAVFLPRSLRSGESGPLFAGASSKVQEIYYEGSQEELKQNLDLGIPFYRMPPITYHATGIGQAEPTANPSPAATPIPTNTPGSAATPTPLATPVPDTAMTIYFNPNGGSGTMEPLTLLSGVQGYMPACGFTPPAGKRFQHWQLTDGRTFTPGAAIRATESGPASDTALAVWEDIPGDVPASAFTDVNPGQYFYDAVSWAVNRGITTGIGGGKFGPGNPCTRGQIITFLWNAAGKPEPASLFNPFADVKSGDYFYKAVLWANQNGIAAGTDASHFSPGGRCTRAQAVTLIWGFENRPAPSAGSAFADVPQTAYYARAVDWAVEKGLTTGTGRGKFSPGSVCTRGQIVTFLYKDLQ